MGVGVITGVTVARSGVSLLARVLGNAGAPITQASLSGIAWALTDLTAGVAVASGTFTVSGTVFDSLQLDPRWTVDGIGYNFLGVLAATNFPAAAPGLPTPTGHRFQADVRFSPVAGEGFVIPYQFVALPEYG